MSDKLVRIDTLPPTTAGLNRALTILARATGCPNSEAERLLSQWDALVARYGEAEIVNKCLHSLPMLEAEARERQRGGQGGTLLSQRIEQAKDGKATQQAAKITQTNRQYISDAKRLRDEAPPLPVRVSDQVYQAALL